MRDLEFIINGQMIKKDPACSFNNIVAGSSNFYNAKFNFGYDWDGFACVAAFEANGKIQYVPIKNNQCLVPNTVINEREYLISVIGMKGATMINTNKVKITQTIFT